MNARNIPAAIQWHEGMLLTPEHFRLMTQRQEMLSEFGMKCAPFGWGLVSDPKDPHRLPYDAGALASGTLAVTDLEAVMPDGTVLHAAASDGLTLDLKPFTDRMKTAPVPLYLVLPARKPLEVKGDAQRYQSVPAEFDGASLDMEADDAGIPRWVPRLSLMAGPDPIPPNYTGIPLVLVRFENGAFLASLDYVAPLLSVPRPSALGSLCLSVAQRIREKASYLAELVRSTPPETSIRRMLQIQSLVAGLPVFEANLATDRAHPYGLYLALCAIAGNVAGVGDDLVPPAFPPYDHNDPRAAFERLRQYLFQAMEEGISERWLRFRFHREEKRFTLARTAGWAEHAGEASAAGSILLGIRGGPGVSEERIQDWGRNCLIGSRSVIPSLISWRIVGAARELVERLDEPLPARGITLFSLTADPEFIRHGEDLQVFDPRVDSLVPAELLFYVHRTG
jgi:type VI secretion system protein ImpJ